MADLATLLAGFLDPNAQASAAGSSSNAFAGAVPPTIGSLIAQNYDPATAASLQYALSQSAQPLTSGSVPMPPAGPAQLPATPPLTVPRPPWQQISPLARVLAGIP